MNKVKKRVWDIVLYVNSKIIHKMRYLKTFNKITVGETFISTIYTFPVLDLVFKW